MSHAASTAVHGGHHAAEHHKDYLGAKMGMWLFLYTEVLLFSGLFLLFGVYFHKYLSEFIEASGHLNLTLGTVNTFVLLTSSLTIGMSLTALKKGDTGKAKLFLYLTMLLAAAFLGIKMLEWIPKFEAGLYPNSEVMKAWPEEGYPGKFLFYNLYYVMTGLHGIHVLIGFFLMLWVAILIQKGNQTKEDFVKLENVGLYWDLVHIVWVFLFPLFYLIWETRGGH